MEAPPRWITLIAQPKAIIGQASNPKIAHEGHEITCGDRLKNRQPSTQVEDDGHGEIGEEKDDGEKHPPYLCHIQILLNIILAQLREFLPLPLLQNIGLDHSDTRNRLPHPFGE